MRACTNGPGLNRRYRMVLDLDPDHENARHNLDVIARAREAERALREASEQQSDRPGMRDGSQTDAADSGDESETVEDGAKTGGNSVQAAATPEGIPGHTTGSGLPGDGEVTGGLAGQSNAPGESSVPEDLVGDSGGRTQDTEASGNIELLFGLIRDDPRRVLTARLKAAHAQGEDR